MESDMLGMAIKAATIMADPERLGFLSLGVLIGLVLGVIPGLGGLVGLSLLLPFTFDMDPYTALAFLMGLQAVVVTSDTIPAVLFGVSGDRGVGGDDPRRISDGPEGRGGARLRRGVLGVRDRRHLRRVPARDQRADPAPGDAPYRLARAVVVLRVRPVFGRGAERRHAVEGLGGGLYRADGGDRRRRPADRDAALDIRFALSLGRAAGGAAGPRAVRDSGDRRHGDHAAKDRGRGAGQVRDEPAHRHPGRLPQLVPGAALRDHRLQPRRGAGDRRLGDRLDRLRPRRPQREGCGDDLRQGRCARRHRLRKLEQRQGRRGAGADDRLRRARQRVDGADSGGRS